ncbi:phage tail sheath C-terminal domain-containing protein [Streptomyces canus]|uniref:phage tail sheath C-terminal domain-containing protein n=1 Tax=Streptomyces canus TaxID=58343 RepID=UPI0036876ABE
MPEYLSPGVYIEEIEAGPRPIAGVSTSTAGMVGVTQRGPTDGKPVLVTSFKEYRDTFGGYLPPLDAAVTSRWENDRQEGGRWWLFPLAVQGFFENGGQRLFVKRVSSAGAAPSKAAVGKGWLIPVTRSARSSATAPQQTLTLAHVLGIENGASVTLLDGVTGDEVLSAAHVTAYDATTGTITLDTPLPVGKEVRAGQHYVQLVPGGDATATLTFTARSPGSWADDNLRVRVLPAPGETLALLADPAEGDRFVSRLKDPADPDASDVLLESGAPLPRQGWVLRFGTSARLFSIAAPPVADAAGIHITVAAHPDPAAGVHHQRWERGLTVQRVRAAFTLDPATAAPADRTLRAMGAESRLHQGAWVRLDNGRDGEFRIVARTGADHTVVFTEPIENTYLETARLTPVRARVSVSWTDPSGPGETEEFGGLTFAPDHPDYLVTVVNDRSRLVRVAEGAAFPPTAPEDFPAARIGDRPIAWAALSGGDDKYAELSVSDFQGVDGGSGRRTGIQGLEDIDEVAICAVPGMWAGSVLSSLIEHCEALADRFAVIDPPDGLGTQEVIEFRGPFDTKNAALYYPWLNVLDAATGRFTAVPPSGHLLGVYARVDDERGVHKAPANVRVNGVRLRDSFTADVTKRHQDLLNPQAINVLRSFPSLGNLVWGARTLSSNTSWRYVSVRRLFLFLEESIAEGTQWVVFEPNGEPLWALVRQTVSTFLETQWRIGLLGGLTPDEAFSVRCDRTTMSEDDQRSGRLICEIRVLPVFPAEFVVFRVQQRTREAQQA